MCSFSEHSLFTGFELNVNLKAFKSEGINKYRKNRQ